MALDFLLGKSNFITTHDSYLASSYSPSRVHISCPGKKVAVQAMLSDGFSISIDSKWQSLFNGGVGGIGAKALDIVDNLAQMIGGLSIRQPYFGRKYWQGSSPLAFSFSFQFVAFENAKSDVYDPMVALMSLLYPRIGQETSTASLLSTYFIPGPNLFYDNTSGAAGNSGDRVEISLGSFLFFRGCYITKLVLSVENSFSVSGFPNCVKAALSFETMDVAFVNNDGTFMQDGFRDASVSLGSFVQEIRGLAQKGVEMAGKAVDKVGGFMSNVFSNLR